MSLVVHAAGGEAAALARKGARNMFPDAKLKSLPPLLPGSKREQFRERKSGSQRQGEVTTIERDGAVYFLVLNASTGSYPKLKDEYATFVKSLRATRSSLPGAIAAGRPSGARGNARSPNRSNEARPGSRSQARRVEHRW